ncbi:YtfJ family protein [Halomonas sp. HNIBRBA4712]|uniref:YtfJ family protein n=1 Tax=Halomonas sp. HNIBRBA4712 TaxID=3373087 RepID=UPI0037452374
MIRYRFTAAWRLAAALTLASAFFPAFAFEAGEPVAPVQVADRGELVLEQGALRYRPWSSAELAGSVGVVLHVAGRLSARDLNAPIIEAIEAADFPSERFQATTIVNTDDAVFGSSMFVRKSVESSKRDVPEMQFVVDEDSAVQSAWNLARGGSAVVVHDAAGRVRFAKDGPLTLYEVNHVMDLLSAMLDPAEQEPSALAPNGPSADGLARNEH